VPTQPEPTAPEPEVPPAELPSALVGELVVNGDAETGTTGWVGELVSRVFGVDDYPGPVVLSDPPGTIPDAGDRFFSGPDAAAGVAIQTIDLSAGAEAIDQGAVIADLSAYLGGYLTQNDRAQVVYQFRDGNGQSVGAPVTLGPVTNVDRNNQSGYLHRTASVTLLPGVRDVVINFETLRSSGTANDGYADNISLRLSTPDPS
jgi:hypothetical protein